MIDVDAGFLKARLVAGAFQKFLGLELAGFDPQAASVALDARWRPEFEREPGSRQWHGGVLAALIDVAGDFAVIARLGRGVPTVDLRVDYLRPATGTDLRAEAAALRIGRTIGTVDVALRDTAGNLVATGRGTYFTQEQQA
jgi:uncharacterized protein (TIGR00369 family)